MIQDFWHRAGTRTDPYPQPMIIGLFMLVLCMSTVLSANATENTTSTALAPTAVATQPSQAVPQPSFAARSTVQAFVKGMHQKHGIDQQKLLGLLAHCYTNRKVLALMDKQFEALPWYKYKARVVTSTRIQEGAAFWKLHAKTLKDIHKTYGVPPEMIVSIIGLETSYGKIMGSFNVLETLSTLAFDYPRRAPFFKKELRTIALAGARGRARSRDCQGILCGRHGYAPVYAQQLSTVCD